MFTTLKAVYKKKLLEVESLFNLELLWILKDLFLFQDSQLLPSRDLYLYHKNNQKYNSIHMNKEG